MSGKTKIIRLGKGEKLKMGGKPRTFLRKNDALKKEDTVAKAEWNATSWTKDNGLNRLKTLRPRTYVVCKKRKKYRLEKGKVQRGQKKKKKNV